MDNLNSLVQAFYRTERRSNNMSDQGGPFGFDIHFALEIDYLLKKYNCDAFIETGTNLGDTTDYVSKLYPELNVITCEVDQLYHALASERLKDRKNVKVYYESSEQTIKKTNIYKTPLYYLDAHWGEYWPLRDEILNIEHGIICVSDFYVGEHDQFNTIPYGFDSYNGIRCDKNLIMDIISPETKLYKNNNKNLQIYPLPCLQMMRRSGRCYFTKNMDYDFMKDCEYFIREN